MHTWIKKTLQLSLGLAVACSAAASDYPNQPITLVIPVAAGGALDLAGRTLATYLKETLGQSVVVDNKPGGSGNIAYSRVARAKPDGYTLLFSYEGFHAGSPAVNVSLPWDPVKSFTPIAEVTRGPHVITVPKNSPAKDLASFIALAQDGNNRLNYGSSGIGSLQHLGTEQFKLISKTQITHVPYTGAAPAMQDLLADRLQLLITTPPTVLGQIQSGNLRALAISSATRHPMLPQVPTTAEAGLPGFTLEAWFSIFGPAQMPPAVVDKLASALQKVVTSEDFKNKVQEQGSYASYKGPQALAAELQKDLAHWKQIVQQAHIQPE